MKGTRLALVTGRTGETTPKQGQDEPTQRTHRAGDATTKHTNLATSGRIKNLALGSGNVRFA